MSSAAAASSITVIVRSFPFSRSRNRDWQSVSQLCRESSWSEKLCKLEYLQEHHNREMNEYLLIYELEKKKTDGFIPVYELVLF